MVECLEELEEALLALPKGTVVGLNKDAFGRPIEKG